MQLKKASLWLIASVATVCLPAMATELDVRSSKIPAFIPVATEVKEVFQAMDLNRDGYLSKPEAAQDGRLIASFGLIDANRDGQLSSREFGAKVVIVERAS